MEMFQYYIKFCRQLFQSSLICLFVYVFYSTAVCVCQFVPLCRDIAVHFLSVFPIVHVCVCLSDCVSVCLIVCAYPYLL